MKRQQVFIGSRWLACPEIERMDLQDAIDEEGQKVDWGWCKITDLLVAVNMALLLQDLGQIPTAAELFDRFGLMNGYGQDGKPLVTWLYNSTLVLRGEKPLPEDWSEPERIYVPAGWVSKVLKLVRAGIVNITADTPRQTGILLDGEEFIHYDLVYHNVVGETFSGQNIGDRIGIYPKADPRPVELD
jgi:hypothetical protein